MNSLRRPWRSPEVKWFAGLVERALSGSLAPGERLIVCFRAARWHRYYYYLPLIPLLLLTEWHLDGWLQYPVHLLWLVYLVLVWYWYSPSFVAATADRLLVGRVSRWTERPRQLLLTSAMEGMSLTLVRKGLFRDRFELTLPDRKPLRLRVPRRFRSEVELFGLMLETPASTRASLAAS